MIHDLTDLEPIRRQYDHEKLLVGPLFNLWTNSSFRVFNIAGKSGKIYETIALGFFELEMVAQRRRADIVAALEACFGEVEIFDTRLEMAQKAHALWANDETAQLLATVSRESKPRPIGESRQKQDLADPDKVTVLSGDRNNESRNEGAGVAVAPPDVIDPGLTHAPQSAGGEAQPTLASNPAQISEPLYLRSRSDAETYANPETLAQSDSSLETVRNLPAAVAGSSVSKKYGFWALSAAHLVLCFVVGFLIGKMIFASFTSARQTASEATLSRNAAALVTPGNDPSLATGTAIHPIPASSIGTANREAQPREAERVTSPSLPTSQPSVAGGEADTAPLPRAQPLQNPTDQAAAAPDEKLSQSPKAQGNQSGDSGSPPQSSQPQTEKTQSSAAETVPLQLPQPLEVAPAQAFVSPASTQITAGHDGPQLLPSDATASNAPEAPSIVPQRQASNSAIVPLPRPRPAVSPVPLDRSRHRVAPVTEGARNPLLSLFGH
jgi:hypothetical protein